MNNFQFLFLSRYSSLICHNIFTGKIDIDRMRVCYLLHHLYRIESSTKCSDDSLR